MTRVTVLTVLILMMAMGYCLGQADRKAPFSCSDCACGCLDGARCRSTKPPPWEDVVELPVEVVLRPKEQIEAELQKGCSLDTNARDRNVAAKVTCPPSGDGPWKGNGDCCCEAKQEMICPISIQCDGETLTLVNGVSLPGVPNPLYQCLPIIQCGEPGQCQFNNCQPITAPRPVIVESSNGKWEWRTCDVQTGCKCMYDHGQPCGGGTGGWRGGDPNVPIKN